MKHTKEKGRAPPKGRRRLEFGAPKQQLPLLNKAVYMDIKNSRQADLMEEQLKKLGARVEKFLSVEVNYVISSLGPSKPDEKLGREENPQSPSFVASPFNCVPSSAAQPDTKTVAVSRGKALAQIACAKNKASSVVTSAEKLGIKVISAEAATKWLEKELRKMKCSTASNIKESISFQNKSKKADMRLKESKTKSSFLSAAKPLSGSFIKFEDSSRHYRPVKVELDGWPRLNLTAPPGICPFGEAKVKVQNLYGARNRVHESSHVVGCVAVPAASSHVAPNPVDEKARSVEKPANKAELVGVPLAPTGDAKQFVNFQFKKSLAINKQQGFCDCCGVKFQNMEEHVRGEQHRSFSRQKANYESLDALISQIPSTVDFLQSVLLKHCVQRHEEPTVSSCVPAQYINLVPPISPLTTDKIHALSLETAAPCLKTPDPSGQDIAAFREHLTATDGDLISKRDTVTPTKQEPTVDSRPQAVVIRRPMPSGIFTSPRRRPVTPSKKPWMQERSMVFSDSPIGSLQPSLCTSKETLPNFLTDNTVNSLTRLANVCDKSNARRPNHSSEGVKVSKNLFSIILNQNFAKLGKRKSGTAQLDKKVTDLCQTKIVAVEPDNVLKHCHLEENVESEICKDSHNENMPNVEDEAADSCHLEKFNSLEKEAEIEHDQIKHSLMINKESEANGSCHKKIRATKRTLEVNDIHSGECITLKKEIVSHNMNNLVDEKKQMEDSENINVPVEEEIKLAASIHEKYVNGEEKIELVDWDQEIEMSAKHKPEKISSSHQTGLSVEHEMKYIAVTHQKIITVEQEKEVTNCNPEKDMTATQESKQLESRHIAGMSVDQGAEVTGCSEFVPIKLDMEITGSGHDRTVTGEKNMEKSTSGHEMVMTVEQGNIVLGVQHDEIVIVEQEEMEVTKTDHDNRITFEQEENLMRSKHDNNITIEEQEVIRFNQEETVIIEQEKELIGLNPENSITVDEGKEVTGPSHDSNITIEPEKENMLLNPDKSITIEQETEVTEPSHNNNNITSEQEKEVMFNPDKSITIEQEKEETQPSHDNSSTSEQVKEVLLNPDKCIIIEQEKEVSGPSHDNSITVEQEKEVMLLNPDKSITIEQEMEATQPSYDNSTSEQEKEGKCCNDKIMTVGNKISVTEIHFSKSLAGKKKEINVFNCETSIAVDYTMENKDPCHKESVPFEEENTKDNSSHENCTTSVNEGENTTNDTKYYESIAIDQTYSNGKNLTCEQQTEEISFKQDRKSTNLIFENKGIDFTHDKGRTDEEEIKEKGFSQEKIMAVEEKVKTCSYREQLWDVQKEMAESSLNHEQTVMVEEKRETSSKDEQIEDVEVEMEESNLNYDKIVIVEDKKETSSKDEQIEAVEVEMEVSSLYHEQQIPAFEQEKDKMGSNQNKNVLVKQKEVKSSHKKRTVVGQENETNFSLGHSRLSETVITFKELHNDVNVSSHDKCENKEKEGSGLKRLIDEQENKMKDSSDEKNIAVEEKEKKVCSHVENSVSRRKERRSIHEKNTTIEEKEMTGSTCKEHMTLEVKKERKRSNHEKHVEAGEQKSNIDSKHNEYLTVEKSEAKDHGTKLIDDHRNKIKGTFHGNGLPVDEKKKIDVSYCQKEHSVERRKDRNIYNHEQHLAGEEKNSKHCKHDEHKTFENKKEKNSSQHEKVLIDEQRIQKKGSNHENNKSIERRNERRSSSHGKSASIEEKEIKHSSCKEGMTVEKKDRKRFGNEKHVLAEEVKSGVESKHDEFLTAKYKENESSNCEKRLIHEPENRNKDSSHEKYKAGEEKKKTKVSNHEEDKSADRKQKRTSSNHGKRSSVEQKETSDFNYKEGMSFEDKEERKRSSQVKCKTAEERKSRKDYSHDRSLAVENKKEQNSSLHEKRLIDEQRSQQKGSNNEESMIINKGKDRKRSNHEEDMNIDKGKDRKRSNHKEDLTTDKGKDMKRSNHKEYLTTDTGKDRKKSIHDEDMPADKRKDREKSNHKENLTTDKGKDRRRSVHEEDMPADKKDRESSNHKEDLTTEKGKDRKRSNHEVDLTTDKKVMKRSNHKEDLTTDKGKDRKRSNHKEDLTTDKGKDSKRSNNEEHASAEDKKSHIDVKHDVHLVVEYMNEDSFNLGKSVNDEPRNRDTNSSHEKYIDVEETKKTKVSHRKEDKSVERSKEENSSNQEKHFATEDKSDYGRIAVEIKEKKSSCHEKRLSDEQRRQQKDSKHAKDKSVEKRNERKSSNHKKRASLEEKEMKYSKAEENMPVEKRNERKSSIDETSASLEETKMKHSNSKEKSVEKRNKSKCSNHEKILFLEEKEMKHSNSQEDIAVDKRNKKKSSNHEKSASHEEKTMKHSNSQENIAVEKGKDGRRSNYEKYLDSKRGESITVEHKKEKKRSYPDKSLTDEQRNRKKSSGVEKYISVEEKHKAKVLNRDEEKSVERKREAKISNNEISLSIEEKEMTGSDCKESKPIEKRKSSNHRKHSATEEKKRNELMAVDYKKEIKNSHYVKELVGEQKIEQKGYNQEYDKRKDRKRSNSEKHGVVEATKSHLDTKHNDGMGVDYKKMMQKFDHEKRLIDESRDRKKSSCHEKHISAEENKKPKVSNHGKDKSVERHKERKLSKHDGSLSVEGKIIAGSSCEEDKVVERRGRKSSDHDKQTAAEEKKNKISDSGECMAVEKNTKKNSDQEKSNVQQRKNRQDCDSKKSLDIGRKTPQVNMNPVVRISGKELRQCIVSDSLAEAVYKHLSGSGMGAKACNLIYVASHKDNINNLLLNQGQAQQGIVSRSESSANWNLQQSKNRQSSYKSEDRSGNKETGSKICKDGDGSKICKDGGAVCVEKSVKSNTESRRRHDKTITTHVDNVKICKETEKATCDNHQVCPSKICRESLEEKLGTCKTKMRKSSGNPASYLGGDLQGTLEKRDQDFEAKKVFNIEKCVKTVTLLEFQGDGHIIRDMDAVDPLGFENPNMKQLAEVGSVSMPADNFHEVVYNSKDSYMDEDTVDTDFYEIHKGGSQNQIVNTDEMNNVHISFPYITEKALLPHSTTQPSSSFCMAQPIPQLLSTNPKSFPHTTSEPPTTSTQPLSSPHTTKPGKTEYADKTFHAKNVDCKLIEDQIIHQQSSTSSSDKLERENIEYRQNSSYKNSPTCTDITQKKQIYSEGRFELNFQQGNIREENCVDVNLLAEELLEGKLIQKNVERINAASDDMSTSTIISCVVGEQSKHRLKGGGPLDYDTDSLSSENMKTAVRNSDEGSDFMELVDWTEGVVVPNIADRVKSRSRVVACIAPAVVGQGVQGSDKEKKAWRRRKRASRERHRKRSVDSINSQKGQQISDRSDRLAARDLLSDSVEKCHKKTQKQKSNSDVIVPNIAESVKQRRSCTLFNHLGQYANSGEGTDAEEENIKVKSRSTEKFRQRRYYSAHERNVKAHSLTSGAEYDKNGLVRQSRIMYCQRRSNDVKVDSSVDMTSEIETDGKTSTLSGGLSKADDDASDLSSAVVVRRKKSHVYPSNKRPEIDWGKVHPADGSSERDPVENNSCGEVSLVSENKTRVHLNILKASNQRWSHSIVESQARQSKMMREAKIVLVDIKTSPQANVHAKISSSDHHSDNHTGTHRSSYHSSIEAQSSSCSCHANIHTHSPTIHYAMNFNIKPSTSPAQTDNENMLTHSSRYSAVRQMETGGHTPCSKRPQFARSVSDVPSSPGISCSPRLRLKIRRRSGNKGFSSTLEEIHDCSPANIAGCSAHVDTEQYGDSCECQYKLEEKYSGRIHHNYPTGPLTQLHMDSNSSYDVATLIPQAQYEGPAQLMPDVLNPCKRKREPCTPHGSDSESTLEYPLSFENVNKRIKLSPGHCTHPDIDDNHNTDHLFEHKEIPPDVTACGSSVNTAASISHNIRPHSSNRQRTSSPCFSSPVTKRHFICFSTPKKYKAPDKSAASLGSPVFNLSMKELRHMHSVHSTAAALSLPAESAPQMGVSCQALKNAGLEANIMLDTSLALKQAADRHISGKRLLSPPDSDFPSGKRPKVDNSLCLAADRNSVHLLECKQAAVPLHNFAESSNHGFRSLVPEAPNYNPTLGVKHSVNHLSPSYLASISQHDLTSGQPYAGVSQLDLKNCDSTPLVSFAARGRNTKQANSNRSDDETVMLLDIDSFSGVSDLGLEDLLNQVHTFSSPDKAMDTSWGDICDTYLSTSVSTHNIQTLGHPVLGNSPAGREARPVSFSPCRKQLKNFNSPFRIRAAEESVRGQTVSGRQDHILKHKATAAPDSPGERTVFKSEANCSGLDAAPVQQELQTPVKNANIEDLNLSPYIQQVDDVISFNFMSPQRVKSNPHETHSSSKKIPVGSQISHRRSCTAPHSRRLFSPARSPQKVSCNPHQMPRSTTQSLPSPPAAHQRSHSVSRSKCLFSPAKTSPPKVNCSQLQTHRPSTQSLMGSQAEHQTHRPSTQSPMGSQAEHQRSHKVFNPKRLFSPAMSSPQGINYSPHHTHKSATQPQQSSHSEHHRSHNASHSKCLSAAHHVS
ncbi:hypothetical protein BsWGS_05098 [Bradybaena similaris]